MRFKCIDTKCPAKGIYYEYLESFIPKEGEQYKHIELESHSYIVPEIYKKKFDNMKKIINLYYSHKRYAFKFTK